MRSVQLLCTEQGLKEVLSSHLGQVDYPARQVTLISFSLAQCARAQESCLPTKSLKEQTKTCPGQAKFENYLSEGQTAIVIFLFLSACSHNFGKIIAFLHFIVTLTVIKFTF